MSNFFNYQTTVQNEWLDYNNHMNDAEYNRVFSQATDAWLAHIGLDVQTIKDIKYTVFTLENHITYQKEVPKNETLNVSVQLIDFDQKRCHVFMNMFNSSNELCSTYEVMLMGIDVESGRPSAFPDNIIEQIKNESVKKQDDSLPRELGRQIGIKRK
ncbi:MULTISPECIES: thioesterase family protein [Mammaliicoccus]|uniref:Thioesterase family protein n=1 Tax=Mammaliicoccus lentus TaxID=42858 RepID=A0ABS6H059_MAMLE|nr:thioesterase family protein [Mammaliicoccus lentus]MBU6114804.1 thioesterase family protein [Mammaliicoccus lentus]